MKLGSNLEINYIDKLNIYSNVDRKDRPFIKGVIATSFTIGESTPKLTFKMVPQANHYNLIIRGWTSEISVKEIYDVMEGPKRDRRCEFVIETSCIPRESTGEGPGWLIKISRISRQHSLK